MLLVGFGLLACELAKRDFADTPSRGTSGDGGASGPGGASSGVSGETSGATGAEVTTDLGSADQGSSNTANPPSGDSSANPTTATNPGDTGDGSENSVTDDGSDVTRANTTGASPEPGDTSGGYGASSGEQTLGSRCDQNILANGNFEAGKEGWVSSSNYTAFEQRVHPLVVENGHESLTNYAVAAHEGTLFAFLGDVPDNEYDKYHTTLTQSIFVPQDAVGLALIGQVWISTQEVDDQEWDIAYIQLESRENSEDYWQFKYWSNRDASEGWVKFDAYLEVVDALRGKHVNLLVQAVTDQGGATRFWFDALEVVVVCSY